MCVFVLSPLHAFGRRFVAVVVVIAVIVVILIVVVVVPTVVVIVCAFPRGPSPLSLLLFIVSGPAAANFSGPWPG